MAIPALAGAAGSASGAAGAGAGAASASSAGSAAAVSGGMTIFSSILNNAVNWRLQQEQRSLQREVNAQNESLMREAWARDDTARQRMVADLEAAGLSKWLAAGASPMNSSPISLSAPQQTYKADYDFGGAADAALHAYQNVLSNVRTEQETRNLRKNEILMNAQIDKEVAEARLAKHNADVYDNRPDVATTDPHYMKIVDELIHQLDKFNNKYNVVGNTKNWFEQKAADRAEKKAQKQAMKAKEREQKILAAEKSEMQSSVDSEGKPIPMRSSTSELPPLWNYDQWEHAVLNETERAGLNQEQKDDMYETYVQNWNRMQKNAQNREKAATRKAARSK